MTMRLRILAIGRIKSGPIAGLIDEFRGRMRQPLPIEEFEVKSAAEPRRMKAKEAELLRHSLSEKPAGGRMLVALDERGQDWSSAEFAARLTDWRDRGLAETVFLIGGPDGLDPGLLSEADVRLSLGRMTWPHALARALLVEQIYRAQQIAAGHPYHRA